MTQAYYGEAPQYAYFTGCSGGGQQALSEAQRYPEDYDGIVAGAPANRPMSMWPGELHPAVLARDVDIAALVAKLPLVEQAVLVQCDAADGMADGLLSDPRTCDFDAASLQCAEGADLGSCLTAEEVEVVNGTYEGLKDPQSGEQVWPGFERSSEAAWEGHLNPFFIQLGYLAHMDFRDPGFDRTTFDFDYPADWQVVQEANAVLAPMLEAANTDLSVFRDAGGKLIEWHGWVDQNIAPRNSIAYANSERTTMGEEADEVLRLFMVPGMQHCQGGSGFLRVRCARCP